MIVYLEGVDGTGKSTLAKELKDRGYIVKRVERDTPNRTIRKVFYGALSDDEYCNKEKVTIFDRGILTDMVYRTKDGKNSEAFNCFDVYNLLYDEVVIFCDNETAYEDSMSRGENNIKSKKISSDLRKLYKIFLRFLKSYNNVKVFEYDWHKSNVNDVIKFIEEVRNGI